jgi:hypothetical protein
MIESCPVVRREADFNDAANPRHIVTVFKIGYRFER